MSTVGLTAPVLRMLWDAERAGYVVQETTGLAAFRIARLARSITYFWDGKAVLSTPSQQVTRSLTSMRRFLHLDVRTRQGWRKKTGRELALDSGIDPSENWWREKILWRGQWTTVELELSDDPGGGAPRRRFAVWRRGQRRGVDSRSWRTHLVGVAEGIDRE